MPTGTANLSSQAVLTLPLTHVRAQVAWVTYNAAPIGAPVVLSSLARIYTGQPIQAPLQILASNTHWFTDTRTKAIILAGDHTWNSLQEWSTGANPPTGLFDFESYLSFLIAHGHNCTLLWRHDLHWNWTTQGAVYWIGSWPWVRSGGGTATDGLAKFDLSNFNQTYFDHLRHRVRLLLNNGIYAIVQLFGGQELVEFRHAADAYPFTAANNINSIDDGGSTGSVTMGATNAITAIQLAYVQKTIDTLNDLPNVIWEVDEQGASNAWWWRNYITDQIHAYELTKPLQHLVGVTVDDGLSDVSNLYTSDADAVSPAARVAPVSNSGKLIVNDSGHSYAAPSPMRSDSQLINSNVLWQNLCSGSSYLFLDPYVVASSTNFCLTAINGICTTGTDTYWNLFRNELGYVTAYGRRFNTLRLMVPRSDLASTTWCLANTATIGSELLVYAPAGGTFTVNVSHTTRSLQAEWLNPATGAYTSIAPVSGGSSAQSFTTPWGNANDAVLYLVDPSVLALATLSASTTLTPTLLTQKVLPVADVTEVGQWVQDDGVTTTNLYTRINESIPNDSTFIESPLAPQVQSYTTRLAGPGKPQAGPILVHTRAMKDASGFQVDLSIDLMQGSTVLQTWLHPNLTTGVNQFDDLVSVTITNWATPFDVRFTATQH